MTSEPPPFAWSALTLVLVVVVCDSAGVGAEGVEEGESQGGERRALRWLVDKSQTGLLIGRKGIGLQVHTAIAIAYT
jgi:hypothetical protein